MNQARHHNMVGRIATPENAVNGIFLVGMFASGIDLLEEGLERLGLCTLGGLGSEPARDLTAFNDRLLDAAGGRADGAPAASAFELAHTLARWSGEAKEVMASALGAASDSESRPWVWGDPRLSFLVPFWSETLDVRPVIILLHRTPDQVAAATLPSTDDPVKIVDLWDRYNRSALVLSSRYPSLVLNYADLIGRPKTVVCETVDFLEDLGTVVTGDVERAAERIEKLAPVSDPDAASAPAVGPRQKTLDRLLVQLDGQARSDGGADAQGDAGLVEITAEFYDKEYYDTSCDLEGGMPYTREERHWVNFFAALAEKVVETLRPESVLDVGCAIGMLVEALRERGVDARGIDISRWAIDQVPLALKPFCGVGSVTEELEGHYDLITCIEVLEHLPPSLAEESVGNLCRHAEAVLFSSTPDDFDEPTHLNVQPTGYWAQLFLRHGFVRDMDYDASTVATHAVLFRRGNAQMDVETLVGEYERGLWRNMAGLRTRLTDAIAEHNQLADRYNEMARHYAAVNSAHDELQQRVSTLDDALDNAQRRRQAETRAAFEALRQTEFEVHRVASLLRTTEAELEATRNTKTFRYTNKLRGAYGRVRNRQVAEQPAPVPGPLPGGTYETWIDLYDTLDGDARRRIESRVQAMAHRPTISVIMPVYNTPVRMLRAAIDSVRLQIYPDWELCIADDGSTDPDVITVLREYAEADQRVKVVTRETNGHISAASNSALSLATGEWVTCLDHDDLLAEHALALVALTLADRPDAGIVYTDEDHLDPTGRRYNAFFKPDFDPLLLVGQNFLCHLTLFRKDLVDRVGGYRVGYEGSQDWDLILRVSEQLRPEQVVHIPHVLYHWRAHATSTASLLSAKPYAAGAGRQAVIDHLNRKSQLGRVTSFGHSGHNRVSWALSDPAPSVSIIVPTHDGRFLQRCLDSVFTLTTYPNFEVVVVDNASKSSTTLDLLHRYDDRLIVIRDERPFNFAAINNHAAGKTTGDVICLLNDDTEVISGEWLIEMVSQLVQPAIGAVGAKLYYEDGRIQHAGVILGIGGIAGHSHRMVVDRLSPGYYGHLLLAHRMAAVTGACMVVRREAWDQVGGMDEANLPIAFNDVDLCLRLRESGWEIVWTPHAELFHYESISRGADNLNSPRWEDFYREASFMQTRWGFDYLRRDPYYNPNLTLDAEDFQLAFPPRTSLDT